MNSAGINALGTFSASHDTFGLYRLGVGAAVEADYALNLAVAAPNFTAIEIDVAFALSPNYLFARLPYARLPYARRQRAGMAGTRPAQLSTRLRK